MAFQHTPRETKTTPRHKVLGTVLRAGALITAGCALGYAIAVVRAPSLPDKNTYPMLNPATLTVKNRDLLVNFQPLRETLVAQYEQDREKLVSIYFEYLPTGANISVNKDAEMWPASLIKIPVAMAAMKKVQEGEWKATNHLVILDEDKDCSYGDLCNEQTGTTMSITDFLRASLVQSDNTAHFVLLRNINAKDIEEIYTHLGLDDIIAALKIRPEAKAEDNRMTAKRYSIFFRSLYNATFLLPEYSQEFLSLLAQSPRELLGQGTPTNIPFAHKIGVRAEESIYADSGIVYVPGRPYLLTVMVQSRPGNIMTREQADALFETISREVYAYVASAEQ